MMGGASKFSKFKEINQPEACFQPSRSMGTKSEESKQAFP